MGRRSRSQSSLKLLVLPTACRSSMPSVCLSDNFYGGAVHLLLKLGFPCHCGRALKYLGVDHKAVEDTADATEMLRSEQMPTAAIITTLCAAIIFIYGLDALAGMASVYVAGHLWQDVGTRTCRIKELEEADCDIS
ncbi:hypothetical protein J5N97_003618 [Dioscorea zingiberensis]|uniref:Uncharacterized protein n=1 Tax=Dioscorea zingiberensis TaxID=325984 RepID=A0A9D5HRE1_9LILI|nr:hypothetical protein J5N97_003618 [Dioscorea zingiberensis]